MKQRCYSSKNPTYFGCKVCDEWLRDYNSFEKWFFANLYSCKESLEIDKDLFGTGKLYSPETCCLLPKSINILIAYKRSCKGYVPYGVTVRGRKYYSKVSHLGKYVSGTFDTIEEASAFYKNNKERYMRETALDYKEVLPEKIFNALYNFKC